MRTAYDGGHQYDFVAALREADKRRLELLARTNSTTPKSAEARYMDAFTTHSLWRPVMHPYGKPIKRSKRPKFATTVITSESLHKHATKFGTEEVREVADQLGINLSVRKPASQLPKRGRRTTEDLIAQVRDLSQRGLVVAAIADTLNISDKRVASLL